VGTDLRKLSLEKTKGILMDLGVPDEDIQALKRWDQIKLISKISTERTQAGETNQKYLQFVRKKKKRKKKATRKKEKRKTKTRTTKSTPKPLKRRKG